MKVSEYMARTGVPDKFLLANLEDTDFFKKLNISEENKKRYTAHYERCKKIVEDGVYGVLLEGIPGSGKSWIGAALLREFLKKGKRAARTTTPEILDYFFKDFQGLRERYTIADVLFIDDLTKMGFQTDSNINIIERLIRLREDEGKITIFSCFSEADIVARFSKDVHRLILARFTWCFRKLIFDRR